MLYEVITVEIVKNPVVQVRRSGNQDIKYAFNNASVGIDAFIANLTNIMKSKIPGDAYSYNFV